ncbi:MAG: 50S ribosomal protein L32 [Erysipelotrichaceae bacterium]|nr:50S ribosomal protein L32 [Erysipelotrichaceae bacterium]
MAVPQRRTSKTAKRLRRTHFYLKQPTMIECPHCGAMIQPHRVCPECGYYDGKQVIAKAAKEK